MFNVNSKMLFDSIIITTYHWAAVWTCIVTAAMRDMDSVH